MMNRIQLAGYALAVCAGALAWSGCATLPARGGEPTLEDEPPLKDFEELTEGAVSRDGFFRTYQKDSHLYLVVPRERLGEDFLLAFEIAQGIGMRWLFGGLMLSWDASLVAIERHGDRLFLIQRPHRFTAPPGSPAELAVGISFGGSVLHSAKIESFGPDSAPVVDIHDWLVSDLSNVGELVRQAVSPRSEGGTPPGGQPKPSLDRDRSYLESVKAFPENLSIRAKLTFTPPDTITLNSVPDARFIPVSIHYTLAQLPKQPMTTRLADDRTGYFVTAVKDFSREDDDTFFARYVRRWRLDPQPGRAGLRPPVRPIVYYLDPNIPVEYRPYVMAGVEAWNRAFEEAGYTNALRAEMLPDGADAEDLRYPTIRWNTSDQPDYGAIGPSVVDPRTGEILDADILIEANVVLRLKRGWRALVRPAASVRAMFEATGEELAHAQRGGEAAGLGAQLAAQGALFRAFLAAGDGPANGAADEDVEIQEFLRQAFTWLTMHEVGHTLGLRHNFRSSHDTPLDRLHDRAWTAENGVFGSVMEYPTVNLPRAAEPRGYYYNPGIGSADRWMIAFGYTPDPERARALAREAAGPGHAYATDEDAYGPGALDPTVNIYDLGDDPLTWARERAEVIAGLWPRLPERILEDDGRFARLTEAFEVLLANYAQTLAIAVKYIGGQYQFRDHVGDPGGRPPFAPVPEAEQREALRFLTELAFGEKAFEVPQEVLARFGANRWQHWGEENAEEGRRIDFPLHEQVLEIQRELLERITHPMVLARIRDAEWKFGTSQVLTIPDLLEGLAQSVWSEVWNGEGRSIRSTRRDLQRAWVDRLTELLIGSPEGLPADARAVARQSLLDVRNRIDRSLGSGRKLDRYTRAHLAEAADRIGKVLDARLELERETSPAEAATGSGGS